ncbi:ABC transporter ATP-binding protein [Nordella sp. HKS 07]|uniref:ABC transporter ATP-binding protein n=1 Tax=Nordella sp. HKS 07 TaxID=2712222 RepID=UPI0013E11CDA|nr:ATP-binding cassette domain-containing protein [Nordella sp. HKS 07]QIG49350.1 ABC transporter ATP-binding protein [Nordella sp. HKS 07]
MQAVRVAAYNAAAPPIMSLDMVSKQFGALKALDRLSLEIMSGEILGIAGPNGAGKSTLLNVCTGVLAPSSGTVNFEGRRMAGLPAHRYCSLGIARTFQIPQIFSSMSVEENIATGAMFGPVERLVPAQVKARLEGILDLTGLSRQRRQSASQVDLLTRKRIMLAASLATEPRLVFLDEPLSGLNAEEVEIFVGLFRRLHNTLGLTLVVVEHKVRALADLSDRILILNAGALLCLDRPEVVMRDARVIDIYLGARNFA